MCNSIPQIILTFIKSMWSDDNFLRHNVVEDISECVRSVSIIPAETNKVTLDDMICMRKVIKTSMENFSDCIFMIVVNIFMRFIDLDLYFVEDRFSANKKVSCCWIGAPNDSRRSIHLNRQVRWSQEPIKNGEIARKDGVFGVLEVGVFHEYILTTQKRDFTLFVTVFI